MLFESVMFIIIMSFLFQAKYNAACLERDDIREQHSKMQTEIFDLKEASDRNVASNKIEASLVTSFYTFQF